MNRFTFRVADSPDKRCMDCTSLNLCIAIGTIARSESQLGDFWNWDNRYFTLRRNDLNREFTRHDLTEFVNTRARTMRIPYPTTGDIDFLIAEFMIGFGPFYWKKPESSDDDPNLPATEEEARKGWAAFG